jgi:diguanylate cyclase (GGDEF)-like protein
VSPSSLSKLMATDARLPTMPAVAARLIEMRDQPDVELEDILRLLSSDPAIASTIMRYVNSPAYLMGAQVETLDRAVVVMGFKAVINIALSLSLTRGLIEQQGEGLDYTLFWQRSLYAATAVRVLGKAVHEKALDELFMAALFQDIGMLALDCIQPDFYRGIRVDQCSHRAFHTAERMQLGTDHAALGGSLLAQWGLHPRTVQAVCDSHNSGRDIDDIFTSCVIASGALADFFISEGGEDAFRVVFSQMYRLFSIREPECKQILIRVLADIRNVTNLFAEGLPAVGSGLAINVSDGSSQSGADHSTALADQPAAYRQDYLSVLRSVEFLIDGVEIEGLMSRAAFENSVKNSFKMLRKEPISVVFVSINNLRVLEETHGAKVAKLLLRVVGRKVLENIRVEDFATRYGDSFALLLIGSAAESARVALQRVVDVFIDARYTIANDEKVALSLNAGIAGQTPQLRYESHEAMMDASAQALLRAKQIGAYSIRSETPDSHLVELSVVK